MPPPSFTSFPDLEPPKPSQRPERKHANSKHASHSRKSKDKELRRRRSPSPKPIPKPPPEEHLPYYSDRKGDKLNVQYGKPDKVPRYSILLRGRKILGLPVACTVIKRHENAIEVATDGFQARGSELTDTKARKLLALAPVKRIIAKPQTTPEEMDSDDEFISVPASRPHVLAHPTQGDTNEPDDSSSSEQDSDLDGPIRTAHEESLISLESQLSQHPDSVPTWLAFLDQSLSSIPPDSPNATKARAEITVSILWRCFSHSTNDMSKTLRLKYLDAGEEIWHESRTRSEWEDALKKVGDADMWIAWVNWRLRGAKDGLDVMLDSVKRALNNVQDETGKLRLFWRAAVIIKDAGYTERATALFQSQGEVLFNCPENLSDAPFSRVLDDLESFWDSELPRFGEKEAKGWKAWDGNLDSVPTASTSSLLPSQTSSSSDPYTIWAANETSLDARSLFPMRSSEESDEDPYSTILFSDIRELLVDTGGSREAKDIFRRMFLSFFGLHTPGFLESLSELNWDDSWAHSRFRTAEGITAIVPPQLSHAVLNDSIAGVSVGREHVYSRSFNSPLVQCSLNLLRPIESSLDGRGEGAASFWSSRDVEGLDHDMIRRLFEEFAMEEDQEWNLMRLAFESLINVKSALKLSKTLLASNQSSLVHWAAHALLERRRGKFDEARKIYKTLLIVNPSGDAQLWWDWAELEFLCGKFDEAKKVILSSVGVEGTSGIHLLRARGLLENNIVKHHGADWRSNCAWINLRALLELCSGSDLETVLSVIDQFTPASGKLAQESLAVSGVQMLYRYIVMLKNPVRPSVLQNRVREAVRRYPCNSILLGILLESEKSIGVLEKWRRPDTGSEEKSLVQHIQDIWVAVGWKKGRWLAEVEKLRTLIRNALRSERLKSCTVLWRLALEIEIRAGDFKQAKKLLYRALGECPLCKDLYLLAFDALRREFDSHELTQFGERMSEQVRLRVGFEEVPLLDGDEDIQMGKGEGDDDAEDDEIFQRAKETRRLMPY